jgi:16S rRNA (adenine1518-N6/adenine1519-N6)-dimethyltransferase
MQKVKAKKHLGQHFLVDKEITEKIAAITESKVFNKIIEIGPGMGVLSQILYQKYADKLYCIEIDTESVAYLKNANWAKGLNIVEGDFLSIQENVLFDTENMAVLGNYPYNISTEIAFKIIANRSRVAFFGGMFQKEVALRLCAKHGNKEYGITSVMLQAYYDCEYLFSVDENAFQPPPKVKSGVMRCIRKENQEDCDYQSLRVVVKTAFSQRRKTLANALKPLTSSKPGFQIPEMWQTLRAEQLSVQDFIRLAKIWENSK